MSASEDGPHEHGPGADGLEEGHDHASLSREVVDNATALRTVWISAIGLGATALFQLVVVSFSGSVGLLSDGLHNVGDVVGTLTLWIALSLAARPPSLTYPFGWRRAEDLGGLVIMLAILMSAILAGYESIDALLGGGHEIRNIPAALVAALVGVAGNEGVARYKITVGRRIDSPALIADGQHARVDGFASLGAVAGILGAATGFEEADAIAGLAITVAILYLLREVSGDVLRRLADGVRPGVLDAITAAAATVDGVLDVHEVRARHAGRAMFAELHIDVDGDLTVRDGHTIGESVRFAVVEAVPAVTSVQVHIDPAGEHDAAHARMDRLHPDVGGR